MRKRGRMFLISAGLCLLAAGARAEDALVVISIAGHIPELHEGQTVKPGAPVRLPAATEVRLLAPSGKVITLQGPYSGPAAQQTDAKSAGGDGQGLASLSKFLTERKMSSASLGTMRSAALPQRLREPQDPWLVVLEDSGQQCARSSKIGLWRRNSSATETLMLRSQDGAAAKLSWAAGDNSQELGQEFAIDGLTFQAVLGSRTSAITLHLLPASLSNPVAIANWMIGKGCRRQAELYLDKLP
jgi:hypothetical protein